MSAEVLMLCAFAFGGYIAGGLTVLGSMRGRDRDEREAREWKQLRWREAGELPAGTVRHDHAMEERCK